MWHDLWNSLQTSCWYNLFPPGSNSTPGTCFYYWPLPPRMIIHLLCALHKSEPGISVAPKSSPGQPKEWVHEVMEGGFFYPAFCLIPHFLTQVGGYWSHVREDRSEGAINHFCPVENPPLSPGECQEPKPYMEMLVLRHWFSHVSPVGDIADFQLWVGKRGNRYVSGQKFRIEKLDVFNLLKVKFLSFQNPMNEFPGHEGIKELEVQVNVIRIACAGTY